MQQYLDLLRDVMSNGAVKQSRAIDPATGRAPRTLSVFGRTFTHDMRTGFPLLTTKRVFWRGVVAEVLWMVSGSDNVRNLQEQNVHIWDEWAYEPDVRRKGRRNRLSPEEHVGDVGPVYGVQWRDWNGASRLDISLTCGMLDDAIEAIDDDRPQAAKDIAAVVQIDHLSKRVDQLQNVITTLRTNPSDRRMVVSAWNPADLPQMGLPPCHFAFQLNSTVGHDQNCPHITVGGRDALGLNGCRCEEAGVPRALDLQMHMRSTDIFLGLPFNIAGYGLLLEMLAAVTNHRASRLIITMGDLHLYENHVFQAEEQLTRVPGRLPELSIAWNKGDVSEIDDIRPEHITLRGYYPDGAIHAPVSV